MSAVTERIPLAAAVELAERFTALLGGAYERLEIAGSIRRRSATVGDIEIVAVPARYQELDMFGDPANVTDLLDLRLQALEASGDVERALGPHGSPLGWGPLAKYFVWQGVPIDLFSPSTDRFGWILALRTGPADFSNALVTPTTYATKTGRRGLLPAYMASRDGWLTMRMSGEKLKTPTEEDVFRLLDLPYAEPWERT
jgi:DNA polymerase/3'-5' exonuclease PolX